MKRADFEIEQLLNAFIDGQLSERQQTQVQRLIAHDDDLADRLRGLKKCRLLMASLPTAGAPPGLLEGVRASLDNARYRAFPEELIDRRRGARHLLGRRVLAAAAMVALVAVLGAVVYTVLSPRRPSERPPVAGRIFGERTGADREPYAAAAQQGRIDRRGHAVSRFVGTVDLRTDDFTAVDAFVRRVIGDNALLRNRVEATDYGSAYELKGSPQAVSMLLNDLESIWEKLRSADMYVAGDLAGGSVKVANVGLRQIDAIVKAGGGRPGEKTARDLAAFNGMEELLPGRALADEAGRRRLPVVTIPKPVMTGRAGEPAKPAWQRHERTVEIVIELSGADRRGGWVDEVD
jgi:hypothetical protein